MSIADTAMDTTHVGECFPLKTSFLLFVLKKNMLYGNSVRVFPLI